MTAITWTDVIAVCKADATALATVDPIAQAGILAHVNSALDVTLFPDGETDPRLFLARCYLAGHFAMPGLGGAGGVAGPALSDGAGSLSTSYGNTVAVSDNSYDTTAYGRAYRKLIRPLGGGFAVSMAGSVTIPGTGWY